MSASVAIPPALCAAARARPHHAAVDGPEGPLTYAALEARAARWAACLDTRGVGPGATVAVVGSLDHDWVTALHAVLLTGAVAAPLDERDGPEARARAMAAHGATWCLEAGRAVRVSDAAAGEHREAFALDLDLAPLAERLWSLDDARVSLLTSGTTGAPRTVRLTTAQLVFSAMGSAARLGHHLDDRWLACLSPHHVGGLSILLRTAWLATTAVLEPRFDAARVAARLDAGDVSVVSLVPAMLSRVLDARPADRAFPARLRVILLGGDRAPAALIARARAIGAPLAVSWGMTEAASQIATLSPEALAEWAPDLAGPPLPFAAVSTAPDGALLVRGPLVAGGALVTADRGRVREDGAVVVEARRDLVFVSGGENVDPARVEAALCAHPAIEAALVVGVPDAELGQRTAAVLVPRPTAARPSLTALRESLAGRLSRAERPSRVSWQPALPLGASGKPSRERARALLGEPMEETT